MAATTSSNPRLMSRRPIVASSAPHRNPPPMAMSNAISQSQRPSSIINPPPSVSSDLRVLCGPLLNYRRTSKSSSSDPQRWHGSVLLVTTLGQPAPPLELYLAGTLDAPLNVQPQTRPEVHIFQPQRLYEDLRATFWRYLISVPLQPWEAQWTYDIPGVIHANPEKNQLVNSPKTFAVPASKQNMRIMFHSCNGFSIGTDEDAWSGCALWNDVLRQHNTRPIHVMIGGGDQIYNDGIRIAGPLGPWTDIHNPMTRKEFPFDGKMRDECDDYYLNNYLEWYSTSPFADANSVIPQINIWDDHDIIDGFGSYTDHFMRCAVFRGIGEIAFKHYLLFQHHVAPPRSTFTTDARQTMVPGHPGDDPLQTRKEFVLAEPMLDPSYILGPKVGPYVNHRSLNILTSLGPRLALLGIDARTERTRHQVNFPETYDLLFRRVDQELAASGGRIKHLILLLGIPIAYPRLAWLENALRSPIIGPIKLLHKRFGWGGAFFNQFDGSVEFLDDLDDHYTAGAHKRERRELVLRLQEIAWQHSVRVTILGGDVHLAACGRFYSRPQLGLLTDNDHRYMVNIISSAITNHPPPAAVANLLARRNKIHHLDQSTDETLLQLFDKDPGEKDGQLSAKKTARYNKCTMPSRNYALISESSDCGFDDDANGASNGNGNGMGNGYAYGTGNGHGNGYGNGYGNGNGIGNGYGNSYGNGMTQQATPANKAHHNLDLSRQLGRRGSKHSGNPRHPISAGEAGCGVAHPAASGLTMTGLGGRYGLDVTYRVEIDHSQREGWTDGYGLSIPGLEVMAK